MKRDRESGCIIEVITQTFKSLTLQQAHSTHTFEKFHHWFRGQMKILMFKLFYNRNEISYISDYNSPLLNVGAIVAIVLGILGGIAVFISVIFIIRHVRNKSNLNSGTSLNSCLTSIL